MVANKLRRLLRAYRLLWLEDRCVLFEDEARRRIEDMEKRLGCLELSQDWIAEFQDWRLSNPVPAEPLVSVCIATYNRAELVTERSVASILRQTYPRLELIVVGDHCTDDTGERLSKIQDSRLRYVNLPNRGYYPEDPKQRWMVAGTQAMNKGLSMARGDLITHLDDDDEHMPDRLEKLVKFIVQAQYDFVWHPFFFESEPDKWVLNEAQEMKHAQVTTSSVLYRSWFARVGWSLNAARVGQPGDWNRFQKIKMFNPSVARFPEPLLKHYRERNQKGVRPVS